MTTSQKDDCEARRNQAYVHILDVVREAGEISYLTLTEQCATQFPEPGLNAAAYFAFTAHLILRGLLDGRQAGGRSHLKLRLRTPEKVHELLPQAEEFLLQLCGNVNSPGLSEREVLAQTWQDLKKSGEKAEAIEDATNWALFSLIAVKKKLRREYFCKGTAIGCRIFARIAKQTEQRIDWTIPLDTEPK